jgi:GTP-binding protein
MIPTIALVGRPNVGKSTLFNQLTRSRDALVANYSGLTRDRHYGKGLYEENPFFVIDTGGMGDIEQGIDEPMLEQSRQAIEEADLVIFLVDARAGLTPGDEEIAHYLRRSKTPVYVAVNKIDGLDQDLVLGDFYRLGFDQVVAIAASHGRGIRALLETTLGDFDFGELSMDEDEDRIRIAVVGRPNVGKSTLINRMLGEERVVVFDMPGTTRDSIYIDYERDGKAYTLIDTAGVRKRKNIRLAVEKFSIVKTLQAIENAQVVILLMDASEGVVDQDLHLLGQVIDAGRSLVVAMNKWDGLEPSQRDWIKRELERRLVFVNFAELHFISALHGTGVGNLYQSVEKAFNSAAQQLSTNKLTRILGEAVKQHSPPLVRGRRIKLRYAHSGGHHPPVVVIHGNQTEELPNHYVRYLEKYFRQELKLEGTPIKLVFKTGENPYKDKKQKLTLRQAAKRRRLMKHVKGRK